MPRDQQRLREWRAANRDRIIANQTKDRERYRREAFDHYGTACVGCGQSHPGFLSLDHLDGGGTHHRVAIGGGGSVTYRWLAQQGYPEGYRVLCLNCNLGVAKYDQYLSRMQAAIAHWRANRTLPEPDIANKEYRRTFLRNRRRIREVIGHYGGCCACCEEDFPSFLAIDHENGRGNEHRKEVGYARGGFAFYLWLRRSGYPDGFRVLCHNCNFGVSQAGGVEELRALLGLRGAGSP